MQNNIAIAIKIYAVLNFICGVIFMLIAYSNDVAGYIIAIIIGCIFVSSFGIYAVGEIIQLLEDIKYNIRQNSIIDNNTNNQLPPL